MRCKLLFLGIVASCVALVAVGVSASPGITTRVSVDSSDNQANGASYSASISSDGRYVAFWSTASNLVSGDTNGKSDVFVRDRQSGQTTRVSVDGSGNEANGDSQHPSISADGRYVSFQSAGSNLVPGDTNGKQDVFVYDRQSGQVTRVSVDSAGNQANSDSYAQSISADGQYVGFASFANNLVPGDTNSSFDVFVHDRQSGQTTRESVDSAGNEGNANSLYISISVDGLYVALGSVSSNLVSGDTNGKSDVFLHDRQSGQTTRVSVDSAGNEANGDSSSPSISADGRYVAFLSDSTNLVLGDTNGKQDVFVHDRQSGQTTRVSVDSVGGQGNGYSYPGSISADGRYVAFYSNSSNLASGDTNGKSDVFVHDRQSGQTTRVSVDSVGGQGNGDSMNASISTGGRYVAFASDSYNLVPGDTNGFRDVFVHESAPDAVGGIAEYPQPEGLAASSGSGSSVPSYVALAGIGVGGALLLIAGGWYAARRCSER